ncbi:SCO family protein [Priestia filamentosa]|uniref:SCO family protein n=1 Tax=Priestia filamentosa TaxID=1402861 RepID=UPI0002E69656|nr:SCO family protein [Priestia filamentosa]MDT3762017.1 SCO family protein [Priestia filamentosa]OXS65995.1 SCO family protein [Priestia filamentosa]WCM17105.1 SCO family protein [Priestia filamentosa]WRU96517.1 SCO family protein [Priestia filamentosa]SMF63883.1 protein SCO1/2 [Priestia filamentosa]
MNDVKTLGKAALTALMLFFLFGCSKEEGISFSFQNQENQTFSSEELEGKVWIADFMFTNCRTVCSPMTANMKKLQERAAKQGINVQFISFSVDPEVDTPEKLKEYVAYHGGDFSNWNVLTGYKQEEIETFAKENFSAIVKKPEESDQVLHSTSFYLVDKEGEIVETFEGVKNPPYNDILKEAEKAEEKN